MWQGIKIEDRYKHADQSLPVAAAVVVMPVVAEVMLVVADIKTLVEHQVNLV